MDLKKNKAAWIFKEQEEEAQKRSVPSAPAAPEAKAPGPAAPEAKAPGPAAPEAEAPPATPAAISISVPADPAQGAIVLHESANSETAIVLHEPTPAASADNVAPDVVSPPQPSASVANAEKSVLPVRHFLSKAEVLQTVSALGREHVARCNMVKPHREAYVEQFLSDTGPCRCYIVCICILPF